MNRTEMFQAKLDLEDVYRRAIAPAKCRRGAQMDFEQAQSKALENLLSALSWIERMEEML